MRILPEHVTAIAIDYQERLMPAIHESDRLIKRSSILLEGLRIFDIPILVTRQYPKGLGDTVEPIANALGAHQPFDKTEFSCYEAPAVQQALKDIDRKTVLLCGAEAHVCVLQTLIDLRDAGYHVVLVSDCIGSRTEEDKQAALLRAAYEGGIISTAEAILFEFTRKAGSDLFKQISKLVK